MHKIWMMVDYRQALIGIHVFLAALALIIHFTLLSTSTYNWLEGPLNPTVSGTAAQNSALPQ